MTYKIQVYISKNHENGKIWEVLEFRHSSDLTLNIKGIENAVHEIFERVAAQRKLDETKFSLFARFIESENITHTFSRRVTYKNWWNILWGIGSHYTEFYTTEFSASIPLKKSKK